MVDLITTPLLELTVRHGAQDTRLQVGDGGRGKRTLAPAESGAFEGPCLRGVVVPPWPDYIVERPDGEIRAVLRTDDGALIYMDYVGIGHRQPLRPLHAAKHLLPRTGPLRDRRAPVPPGSTGRGRSASRAGWMAPVREGAIQPVAVYRARLVEPAFEPPASPSRRASSASTSATTSSARKAGSLDMPGYSSC